MRAIDRKLLRELRRHWAQVLSIALVMACGTMAIMGLRSTLASIRSARDKYFDAYHFGDVFVHLERAPRTIGERLAAIPGVAAAETRIVRDVRLLLPGVDEPVTGHVVSLPAGRAPAVNNVHIRRGRWIATGQSDEVIISERFATLNTLSPGDAIDGVINGRAQRLHIVGIGLSPEFVVEAAGGFFVDNSRYGIVWMSTKALETAFDMAGAFNDASVRIAPGASAQAVASRVDEVLKPWGAADAYLRKDQPAAEILENEFNQLATNARVFPAFFLFVSAFLLNVVLSRLVASQRDEIAALKAFGYSHAQVGLHYLGFGVAAVMIGAALGFPLGAWMGARFTGLYVDYFKFPDLPAVIDWRASITAVAISGSFALLGALGAVRRVMKLAPAQALQPESPSRFRPLLVEVLGLGNWIGARARMVLRNIERRPVRTGTTILGVGLAVALLAAGRFPYDAFARLLDVQFGQTERYDIAAGFAGVRAAYDVTASLSHIDGVITVEPFRAARIQVRHRGVARTTSLMGLATPSGLYALISTTGARSPVPDGGVTITQRLASALGVRPGDSLRVELVERAETRTVAVAGVFNPMLGEGVFATRGTVNALMHEGDGATGAYIGVRPGTEQSVTMALNDMPGVIGSSSRAATMRMIDEQIHQSMAFTLTLILTSATVIAVGVVYNSARIALSERGRELASLRVLGFTANEVGAMLMGEQLAMLVLAMPIGVGIGAAFNLALTRAFETERFQFPFVVALRSQLFACAIVLVAAAAAGLVIRLRVKRLDLVAALRQRE